MHSLGGREEARTGLELLTHPFLTVSVFPFLRSQERTRKRKELSGRMSSGQKKDMLSFLPRMLPVVSSKMATLLGQLSRIHEIAILTSSLGGRADRRRREMVLWDT